MLSDLAVTVTVTTYDAGTLADTYTGEALYGQAATTASKSVVWLGQPSQALAYSTQQGGTRGVVWQGDAAALVQDGTDWTAYLKATTTVTYGGVLYRLTAVTTDPLHSDTQVLTLVRQEGN